MKAFRKLFGQKDDLIVDQADALVRVAYTTAVASFEPTLDRFAALQTAYQASDNKTDYIEQFDFLMTIACVFVAVERLKNAGIEETRANEALDRIEFRLNEWNAIDSIPGFEHCQNYFTKEYEALRKVGYEPDHLVQDAVASWIVADALGKPPEAEEERRLVRFIGAMIARKFANWWV